MRAGSPLEALHGAIAAACYRNLPDIEYKDRDWAKWSKMTRKEQIKSPPTIDKKRRPDERDIEVTMFLQGWSSTALGYGGIGVASRTSAYTVIVSDGNVFCVYFGYERLAYKINLRESSPEGLARFKKDMSEFNMAAVAQAGKYQ